MKILRKLNYGVFKRRPEELINNDIDNAVPREDIPNLEKLESKYRMQLQMINAYWDSYKKIDDEQNKRLDNGLDIDPEKLKRMDMIEKHAHNLFNKLPQSLKKQSFMKVFKFNPSNS